MGNASCWQVPSSRPSLRVDAGGVSDLGKRCCHSLRLQRAFPARRPGRFGGWFTDTDGRLHAMKFTIPELSFVVLIGVSGSGKSAFARKHFKPTEILSSDYCRGLVSDDENSQAATKDAFELLHFIARKRLAAGKLTVVDATNVQPESRKPLVEIAREFHCLPVAIVLDVPERVAHDRNKTRAVRDFGPHVIRQQPLWNNLKHEHGPFDIIGDLHGCFDELVELLGKLGYEVAAEVTGLHSPS